MSQLRWVKCDKCGFKEERFIEVMSPKKMECPNCDGELLTESWFLGGAPPVFGGVVNENPDSPGYIRPDKPNAAREIYQTYRKIESKETEGRIEKLRPDKAKIEEKLIKRHIKLLCQHQGTSL
jgi:hypothetical protein